MLTLESQIGRISLQTIFSEISEVADQGMVGFLAGVKGLVHDVHDSMDLFFEGSFVSLSSFFVHSKNNKYYHSILINTEMGRSHNLSDSDQIRFKDAFALPMI